MYAFMVECWHEIPTRRPSFSEIHDRLMKWEGVSPNNMSQSLGGGSNSQQSGSIHSSTAGLTHPASVTNSLSNNQARYQTPYTTGRPCTNPQYIQQNNSHHQQPSPSPHPPQQQQQPSHMMGG